MITTDEVMRIARDLGQLVAMNSHQNGVPAEFLLAFARHVEAEAFEKARHCATAPECADDKIKGVCRVIENRITAMLTNPSPAEPSDMDYGNAMVEIPAPAASCADDGAKCETCGDKKKVFAGFGYPPTSPPTKDCPDCTPNTREEKQAKCECDSPARAEKSCQRYVTCYCHDCKVRKKGPACGICGHDRACHKGDTGNE